MYILTNNWLFYSSQRFYFYHQVISQNVGNKQQTVTQYVAVSQAPSVLASPHQVQIQPQQVSQPVVSGQQQNHHIQVTQRLWLKISKDRLIPFLHS